MLKMNRLTALGLLAAAILCSLAKPFAKSPNILFAISDDQSYPHASAYGCRGIETPGFDRVAREGCSFTQRSLVRPAVAQAGHRCLLAGITG